MPLSEWVQNLRAKAGNDLIMMTGASAVVRNEADEILLQQRADNSIWGLPGGAIEPGEEPAEAVVREVFEETGLDVQPIRIVGVYGGQELVGQYLNGNKYAYISITFECRVTGGTIQPINDESLDVRWFQSDSLPENLVEAHRQRIEHALTLSEPYFKQT